MAHHFRRTFLAVPFLIAGLGVHAGADSISYSNSWNSSLQGNYVPLFNPSYGTLYEVDMSASGTINAGVGDFGQDGSIGGTVVVTATANGNANAGGIEFGFFGSYTSFFFYLPFSGSGPMDVSDLASFYGIGDVELRLSTIPNFAGTYFTIDETIIYLYSVPEPSTAVLGVIGLAGVTWFGRRRRTQSRCPHSPGRLTPPA